MNVSIVFQLAISNSYYALTLLSVIMKSLFIFLNQKKIIVLMNDFDKTYTITIQRAENDRKMKVLWNSAVSQLMMSMHFDLLSIYGKENKTLFDWNYLFSLYFKFRYVKVVTTLNIILSTSGALMYVIFAYVYPAQISKKPLTYDTWAPFDQFSSPFYEVSYIFQVNTNIFSSNAKYNIFKFCRSL